MDEMKERLKKAKEQYSKSVMDFKVFYTKFSSNKSDIIVVVNLLGEFMKFMLVENEGYNKGMVKIMQNQSIFSFCRKHF